MVPGGFLWFFMVPDWFSWFQVSVHCSRLVFMVFHGFRLVFFIFHIENTLKLYSGQTIKSRPCRPWAGFGLVSAKSCFTLSVFRDIPSPVTGHYTQVKHPFCPRDIGKFAHLFVLWQPFSNPIYLTNPVSVCLIRQIWIFNEKIWIIN